MNKQVKDFLVNFVFGNKIYPLLVGLLPSLYPIMHYGVKNHSSITTLDYLCFIALFFIFLPVFLSFSINYLTKKLRVSDKKRRFIFLSLNLSVFLFILLYITLGLSFVYTLLGVVSGIILSYFLKDYLNKILVLQIVIILGVQYKFLPHVLTEINYQKNWMNPVDDILDVKLKITPNIYLIQTDGYTNFSTVNKPPYSFNNSKFKSFLLESDFTIYPDFRSNYFSTLSSNSSLFAMKHHYYSTDPNKVFSLSNSRNEILGDNPVLQILKDNNYTKFLLLDQPYLIINRVNLGYDYCNIDYADIGYFSEGFDISLDANKDLDKVFNSVGKPTFTFIQHISPGHISSKKFNTEGKELEKEKYLRDLKKSNIWLTNIVNRIQTKDDKALIILLADHGGFVGLDYVEEIFSKQTDPALVKSAFSSLCAIKWPKNLTINDKDLKTSVNLFRVLFSNLSKNDTYLKHLQNDFSYTYLKNYEEPGIYSCLNESGQLDYEIHH